MPIFFPRICIISRKKFDQFCIILSWKVFEKQIEKISNLKKKKRFLGGKFLMRPPEALCKFSQDLRRNIEKSCNFEFFIFFYKNSNHNFFQYSAINSKKICPGPLANFNLLICLC